MSYVILVRNPRTDSIIGISEPDSPDRLAVFATEGEAEECAKETTICQAWPYLIVEAP